MIVVAGRQKEHPALPSSFQEKKMNPIFKLLG